MGGMGGEAEGRLPLGLLLSQCRPVTWSEGLPGCCPHPSSPSSSPPATSRGHGSQQCLPAVGRTSQAPSPCPAGTSTSPLSPAQSADGPSPPVRGWLGWGSCRLQVRKLQPRPRRRRLSQDPVSGGSCPASPTAWRSHREGEHSPLRVECGRPGPHPRTREAPLSCPVQGAGQRPGPPHLSGPRLLPSPPLGADPEPRALGVVQI